MCAQGRTTLLLSPPGSGKSTLLKVLAGRYRDSPGLHVGGRITYNGHTFDEFNVNRTSAFIRCGVVQWVHLCCSDTCFEHCSVLQVTAGGF